jgi:3-oxoacyl-[acyl-carrier-protein] synthase-3
MGLFLFEKIYPEFKGKIANNLSTHGNCIAASIPMALYDSIEEGKIKRGDIVVLAGTSAGFSIGGLILKY